VQTLSRLNRTHPDKDGTFVLDFVNDANEIARAFEPYYGMTVTLPTDPNLLYDTRRALDEFGILRAEEAEAFARLLLVDKADHGRLHGVLNPAVARFDELEEDEQERFRDALSRFVRTYSFLSLIVPFGDTTLERDYLLGRALLQLIRSDAGETVDLGSAVELTHLRVEQRFSGSVSLDEDVGEVRTVYSGEGRTQELDPEPLSRIIDRLNQQFGTDWSDADRLVFDAAATDLVNDPQMQMTAANNTVENFLLVFGQRFQQALLERMDRNHEVVFKYLDNPDLSAEVVRAYGSLVQTRAKVAYQEHCPIGELLGPDQESQYLEYKATLRTRAGTGELYKPLETATIKTVAGFLNSRDGGTLLLGVENGGTPVGLEHDYASLHKPGKDDRDLFQLHLVNVLVAAMGHAAVANLTVQVHAVDGKDLCRVHVRPSAFPVEAKVVVDHAGQFERKTAFYVRLGNGTREITDPVERQKYIASRWSAPAA
jgi:type I restriction enzyme R subunit